SDTGIVSPGQDSLLARVAGMGFDIAGIVDHGDYFLVEGDILLKKSDLPPVSSQRDRLRPSFQYHTTNRVDHGYYQIVYVDYSQIESQNAAWAAAIDQAMAAWNQIPGSSVHLTKWTPDPYYGPQVTIAFGSCPNTAIACATFPSSSGEPGSTIIIAHPGESEKLRTVAHELGHTLGLRHTDWNNRTCYNQAQGYLYTCGEARDPLGAVHIPNTPTSTFNGPASDPASVMNSTGQVWNGFSFYDRVAVRYLFPGGDGPDGQASLNATTPTVTWPAMLDAVQYDVYFQENRSVEHPIYGTWFEVVHTYVGSTSSTSLTDYSRNFNHAQCGAWFPEGYLVRARFADGTQTGFGNIACVGL
ncbi:MAG: hypothetical protein AVDCRST_MAG89-300, partial [uncultured Gemmatimonadetes bacterium]